MTLKKLIQNVRYSILYVTFCICNDVDLPNVIVCSTFIFISFLLLFWTLALIYT